FNDPQLQPSLLNNGGPTETRALLPGSPAIDGGTNAGALATDQRGVARPSDGNGDGTPTVDIGAFEVAFGDTFDDNTVNTTAWTPVLVGSGPSLAETNQ